MDVNSASIARSSARRGSSFTAWLDERTNNTPDFSSLESNIPMAYESQLHATHEVETLLVGSAQSKVAGARDP